MDLSHMPIELSFDQTAYDYITGCPYVPLVHEILPHCWWVKSLRLYAKRNGIAFANDLNVYFHKAKGVYVLFLWMIRPGTGRGPGCMRELEIISGHPDRLEWPLEVGGWTPRRLPRFDYIVNSLRPALQQLREMRASLLSKAREQLADREEEADSRQDMAKHYARRGETVLAHGLSSGMLPWASPRTAGDADEMIDRLTRRDAIITKDRNLPRG